LLALLAEFGEDSFDVHLCLLKPCVSKISTLVIGSACKTSSGAFPSRLFFVFVDLTSELLAAAFPGKR
jgi:hypothetical protein